MMQLRDREEAGRLLAAQLTRYAGRDDVIVLALPRGGVPVGFEIACHLHAPLDVFLVRKLGFPGFEELAMGAIASGGIRVLNEQVVRQYHVSDDIIDRVAEREQRELERREKLYRRQGPGLRLKDQIVIAVDDGLATGSTMSAAIKALKQREPRRIVAAVPVAPPGVHELLHDADEVACLMTPEPFGSVGSFYRYFNQTSDAEVQQLLAESQDYRLPQAKCL